MEPRPVVIDAGSCSVRAGFVGEDSYTVDFPNVVGRPRFPKVGFSSKFEQRFIGEDAQNKRGILALKYPIESDFISNMDDMELILSFCLCDQLGVNPENHSVLMSQVPLNPKCSREKLTEIMFEGLGVPAFSMQTSAVLALCSTGSNTGVVIELGGGVFNASVVENGALLPHASMTLPISGRSITDYLRRDLNNSKTITDPQKQDINLSCFWSTLNDMKHACCFVSQDFNSDNNRSIAYIQEYEMPDGTYVTIDKERFSCTEAIFNPRLYGIEMEGIHHQAYNAVKKAGTGNDLVKQLLSNMVLCGGSSLFPGLPCRLENELKKLNTTDYDVKLVVPVHREQCVWRGGAKMAIDEALSDIWMNKEEYDEYGPTYIHRKTS